MAGPNLNQLLALICFQLESKSLHIRSREMKMLYNNPTYFSKKRKFALSSPKCNVSSKILASFLFIKLWNQISQHAILREVQAGVWHHPTLLDWQYYFISLQKGFGINKLV